MIVLGLTAVPHLGLTAVVFARDLIVFDALKVFLAFDRVLVGSALLLPARELLLAWRVLEDR